MKLLVSYNWSGLWTQLLIQESSQDSDSLRAFLLAGWWQDAEEARKWLQPIHQLKSPLAVFSTTMALICCGNGNAFLEGIRRLRRIHAAQWMEDWVTLEYLGRSKQFKKQADYLERVLQERPADTAYIACIESTCQNSVDGKPLLQVLKRSENIKPLPYLGLLLKARLVLFTDGAGEYRESLRPLIVEGKHAWRARSFAALQAISDGDALLALRLFDSVARDSFLNRPMIRYWLALALSMMAGEQNFLARAQLALTWLPKSRVWAEELSSYVLIHHWANADVNRAHVLISQFLGPEAQVWADEIISAKVFFVYVSRLCQYRLENKNLYSADNITTPLYVVGDSHALSPAHVTFPWRGRIVTARPKFVLGVKMHHLKIQGSNFRKQCIGLRISQLPDESDLLLTIGEIDCRPDEGLWIAGKKKDSNLEQLVDTTVDNYFDCLVTMLSGTKLKSVTIQGVPFPAYPLEGKLAESEKQRFSEMIMRVNEKLKCGAISRGFGFLDVWIATKVDPNQTLDAYHLKPGFYIRASCKTNFEIERNDIRYSDFGI